jgi:hypothetical protein
MVAKFEVERVYLLYREFELFISLSACLIGDRGLKIAGGVGND